MAGKWGRAFVFVQYFATYIFIKYFTKHFRVNWKCFQFDQHFTTKWTR